MLDKVNAKQLRVGVFSERAIIEGMDHFIM